MRSKIIIIISIAILAIVLIFTQVSRNTTTPTSSQEGVFQDKLRTRAEISADDYISSINTDFVISSASTIYDEGDFSVINIETTNGTFTISGYAITYKGEVIIPPNVDYSQDTIDKYSVPSKVVQVFRKEVVLDE